MASCETRSHSLYVEYNSFSLLVLIDSSQKDTSAACSRFTFLHNPASPNGDPGRHAHVSSLFSHFIHKDFLSKATPSRLLQVLGPRGDPASKQEGQTVLNMASQLDEITGGVALANIDRDDYRRYVEETGRMVAKTAGVAPGASGLIINGRMSFPFALSVLYQLLSHVRAGR